MGRPGVLVNEVMGERSWGSTVQREPDMSWNELECECECECLVGGVLEDVRRGGAGLGGWGLPGSEWAVASGRGAGTTAEAGIVANISASVSE